MSQRRRRPRGRPRAEEPTFPLSVRFPISLLDVIRSHAAAHGETVSTWVRRLAVEALEDEGAIGPLHEAADEARPPSRLPRRAARSA